MNKSFQKLTRKEIEDKMTLARKEEDGWEFLYLFTEHYFNYISSCESQEQAFKEFNDEQHTLLAFNYLYGQVCNGGFLQLIQNGYGAYIFENPFSKQIRKWGAKNIANIIEKAKIIYDKNKKDLEKETSLEEFSQMYNDYKDFDPLDDEFYKFMDSETNLIAEYVYKNVEQFADVK